MLYSARSRRSDSVTARTIRHIGKAALFLPFLTILVFPIYHIINNIIAHRSKDGNVESVDHLYTPSFLHYRKQKEEQLPYDEEKKNAYGLLDIAKTAQNLASLAGKR
ncbi:hypothetical protein WR25_24954 [Diploscapter pachys]|uniref:Uncharacterized protein n=1 Tax=Diploscapter pachys TaxID=2018661 RepID=A0A2A2J2M7_9BILA|nr:hypothetical protein WR25_24954 [Diploscapter pachys]